jgi:hypothetical protein
LLCDAILVLMGAVAAAVCAGATACLIAAAVFIGLSAFVMCFIKDDPKDFFSWGGCIMAGLLEGKGGDKAVDIGKRAIPTLKRAWKERKKLWPW